MLTMFTIDLITTVYDCSWSMWESGVCYMSKCNNLGVNGLFFIDREKFLGFGS